MTIKQKTLFICILATAVCLGMIYLMTQIFVVRSLLDSEKNTVELDMLQAIKAISYDLTTYEKFTEDWSAWDDTYRFVQDGNQNYIIDNLMDVTFKFQRLNVMIYFDDVNNIVYAKWYDLAQEQEVYQSPEEESNILRNSLSLDPGYVNRSSKGIIQSANGPLMVVARPVVDSLRQQPAKGTLIVGRYLDEAELDMLSDITNLQISIELIDEPDSKQAGINLSDQGLTKVPVETYTDKDAISAMVALKNIAGVDTYLLTIQEPRHFYKQSSQMLQFFLASIFCIALLFGLIIFMLIERHVLRRLLSLTNSISQIKRFEDIPHNFGVAGNDEIALLAGRLKQIFRELQISHDTLRYISTHDTLTDVYNRAYFEQYLQEIAESPDIKLGVIVCDIDGLKLANDMAGHEYGDELLQNLAAALRKSCPEQAALFRIGGDEFIIIVKDADDEILREIYRRIRINTDNVCLAKAHLTVPLSVSVGYAVCEARMQDIKEVIKHADNLMYREKLLRNQSRRSGLVQTLRSALAARDHITEGHAQRLHRLAVALARSVDMPEQRIPDLQLFAEFHDLGKIGIPDNILFKKGPLSSEEWIVMKKHCEIGFRIAQSTSDLLPIANLILNHHEWWNGTGYPIGLAEAEIPIECRILAIVDAYDAMTNDRPYRTALTKEQAIEELVRCAGIQFDPELIKIFIELLEREK